MGQFDLELVGPMHLLGAGEGEDPEIGPALDLESEPGTVGAVIPPLLWVDDFPVSIFHLVMDMLRVVIAAFWPPSSHSSQRSSYTCLLAVPNELGVRMKKLVQVAFVVANSDCAVLPTTRRHFHCSGHGRVQSRMVQVDPCLASFVVEIHSTVRPGWAPLCEPNFRPVQEEWCR